MSHELGEGSGVREGDRRAGGRHRYITQESPWEYQASEAMVRVGQASNVIETGYFSL